MITAVPTRLQERIDDFHIDRVARALDTRPSRDRTLIRRSLHAALSDRDIDRILLACTEVRDRFGAVPPVRTNPRKTGDQTR